MRLTWVIFKLLALNSNRRESLSII